MPPLEKLKAFIEGLEKGVPNLAAQIAITTAIFLLLLLLRKGALNFFKYNLNDQKKYKKWKRTFSIFSFTLFVLILLPMWLPSLHSFATFLGIFGAGTLIVFKEVIMSMAAWIVLMVRKPFEIGNRVSIGGFLGDVLDIRLLEFTIIEIDEKSHSHHSSGRVVHIPNNKIFTESMRNATQSFAFNWHEILVELAPHSDWQLAIKILEKRAEELLPHISPDDRRIKSSRYKYDIHYKHLTPKIYVDYKNEKICLTIRFLCEPSQFAELNDAFWRQILPDFARNKKKLLLLQRFSSLQK